MTVAPVIHIGGWPGSGKATIGRELANQYGGRLIHNHIFLDGARALFERGTKECAALRENIRDVVLTAALQLPEHVPIIMTDALSDAAEDELLFKPVVDFVRKRGSTLISIVLEISRAENLRRLTDAARQGTKLTDPDVLGDLRDRLNLMSPKGAYRLDVTNLGADEAAQAIADWSGLT